MNNDTLKQLVSISPIDGRYSVKTKELSLFFSESALIKARMEIEIDWFLLLMTELNLPVEQQIVIKASEIKKNISFDDCERILEIEKTTNHDVKAVEYFLKEKLKTKYNEYIHFGLTSEDVNNLSYAILIKRFLKDLFLPKTVTIWEQLYFLSKMSKDTPMIARTHGQPATPTTFGKEIAVFCERIKRQIEIINTTLIYGKLNGAVGNWASFAVAYPEKDWMIISKQFVENYGLQWNAYTKQIETHDYMADLSNKVSLLLTIMIDFCKDMWLYISLNYVKQKSRDTEIGSSTMPHKVNPIDFENAWGNFQTAIALFTFFSQKLPISFLQRDLTDSTVQRSIGSAFGYAWIGFESLLKGLGKIEVNQAVMQRDCESHEEVLAEAIQTVLRKYCIPNGYEKMKELTRDKIINKKSIEHFIASLAIPEEEKKRLLLLRSHEYIGYSSKLVDLLEHPNID